MIFFLLYCKWHHKIIFFTLIFATSNNKEYIMKIGCTGISDCSSESCRAYLTMSQIYIFWLISLFLFFIFPPRNQLNLCLSWSATKYFVPSDKISTGLRSLRDSREVEFIYQKKLNLLWFQKVNLESKSWLDIL